MSHIPARLWLLVAAALVQFISPDPTVAFPDIRGAYTTTGSYTATECSDSNFNGTFPFTLIMNFGTQNGGSFTGTFSGGSGSISFPGGTLSLFFTGTTRGTVTTDGAISRTFTTELFINGVSDSRSEGTFAGTVIDDILSATYSGKDLVGDTCSFSGSLSSASMSVNPPTLSFSPNTITSSDPLTLAITVLTPGGRNSETVERVEVNEKRVELSLLGAFGVALGDTSKSLVLQDVAFPPEIDATLLLTATTPKGSGVATLNVTTTSNRATYTVVVTDADTGSLLPNIRVYLLNAAGGAMRVATTDAAGAATFVEPEGGSAPSWRLM